MSDSGREEGRAQARLFFATGHAWTYIFLMSAELGIQQLLDTYRAHAEEHGQPNDGSRTWSVRVNHAADQMLLIARRVAGRGPEAVAQFGELIGAEDPHLSLWAAHHMLDFMEPPPVIREAALSIIERAASQPSRAAFSEKLWLENYRGEVQDE